MDSRRIKSRIEFIALVLLFVVLYYAGRALSFNPDTVKMLLGEAPLIFSCLLYVLLYVIVTFFVFFAKDVFWISGAFIFGPYLSAFLIWLAEVINACVLFGLSRRLGRAFVEHHLPEKYRAFDERLGRLGFFWIFLLRAAPLIPYRYQDLGAGLTGIDFKKYIAAVVFGSPLKIFWIQYVLAAVGMGIFNPAALLGYFTANKALMWFSLIYPFSVLLIVFKLKTRD